MESEHAYIGKSIAGFSRRSRAHMKLMYTLSTENLQHVRKFVIKSGGLWIITLCHFVKPERWAHIGAGC